MHSHPVVEGLSSASFQVIKEAMCKVFFQQQPICSCIGISGIVELCAVFRSLPENKDKTTFRSKVLTSHCQRLNVCFDGVDYVSVDVEGGDSDVVPKGLDCPHAEISDQGDDAGPCNLCDSEAALKFLKAKGIEHTFDRAARERGMQVAGKDGEEKEFSRVREMMEKREGRAAGKRARSGLAQSTSASTESD